jgi:7-carboxy-7-deazaguanine synthase
MLKLSEIFCSIQGESTYSGFPCIFIRLAGCNLRCSYCDTNYAYTPAKKMSELDILTEIRQFEPLKLVEITGGEPLLQEEVYSLLTQLHKQNYRILLETNGSLDLAEVPEYVTKIVDIKCPGSGHSDSFLIGNLKYLNKTGDEIKFVLTDKIDYEWAKVRIAEYALTGYKIIFSPAFSILEADELAGWILQDKLNIRMQMQLHKYIWDPAKRGV